MTVNNDDRKGVKVYFSPKVRPKSKKTILNTLNDVMNKTEKNKEFFHNMNVKAYGLWSEREEFADNKYSMLGFSSPSIYDDYTIIIRTNRDYRKEPGFNLRHTYKDSRINAVLLHEIGHLFDFYFAKPNEELKKDILERLAQGKEKIMTEEFFELYEMYEAQNSLSDSEDFKEAWQKDVETSFKGKSEAEITDKCTKLEYYSPLYNHGELNPNKQINLKLDDGIDDKEVADADKARQELYAQLFAYAMGSNDDSKKEMNAAVMNTYPNSYEIVKKHLYKYFGIIIADHYVPEMNYKLSVEG